jgi:hypothetical protein
VGFEYFDYVRIPSLGELQQYVIPNDGVTRLLVEAGTALAEISRVVTYEEACGEGAYLEMFRLRPLWAVFLTITNISQKTLTIEALEGWIARGGYRSIRALGLDDTGELGKIDFPRCPIAPDATVIIPVASLLAPLYHVSSDSEFQQSSQLALGYGQSLEHASFAPSARQGFREWGPAIHPGAYSPPRRCSGPLPASSRTRHRQSLPARSVLGNGVLPTCIQHQQ